MRNKTTDKISLFIVVATVMLLLSPVAINAFKLLNCDFESDYRCEVIHGIGVVLPPASYVTAWFKSDL